MRLNLEVYSITELRAIIAYLSQVAKANLSIEEALEESEKGLENLIGGAREIANAVALPLGKPCTTDGCNGVMMPTLADPSDVTVVLECRKCYNSEFTGKTFNQLLAENSNDTVRMERK